jgi:hypothetical protein
LAFFFKSLSGRHHTRTWHPWSEGALPKTKESQLESVVRGSSREDVDKYLDDGEKAKNDPVDQPLRVVALVLVSIAWKDLKAG